MNNTEETLERVVADLTSFLGDEAGLGELPDESKMQVLRLAGKAQRRVDALVVETVASVPARAASSGDSAFCGTFGCRTMNELLQRVLRIDGPGASRVVQAARAVHRETNISSGGWQPARWPALRAALLNGTIGVAGLLAAVGPIENAQRRIDDAARSRADEQLASLARGLAAVGIEVAGAGSEGPEDAGTEGEGASGHSGPPATPEDLRTYARVILAYLDPDGAEPAEEISMRGRGVTLGKAKNGLTPIRGELLPETAGQLMRIWDAYLNPKVEGPPLPGVRFVPSGEIDARDEQDRLDHRDGVLPSGDPGGMVDPRSRAQKQHDALAAALGIAARHDDMPKLGGAAPTVIVAVNATDYATGRGWAHIEGVDPAVPVSAARHTACGGTIQRVLFDPEGRIIGIGNTDRTFSMHQRRAITLRDGECLIPGCHVPASWCEIHHVREHSRGGPTHTDNGVALCWHHHRTLETSGWEIRMDNGRPSVRGPAWWDPHRRWRVPRPVLNGVIAARRRL